MEVSSSSIAISGVFYKLKKGLLGNISWRKRYIEFDGIIIKQYCNEYKTNDNNITKTFDLNRCILLSEYDNKPNTFTLSDNNKSITLSASNENEYNIWIDTLIKAKTKLTKLNEIDIYTINDKDIEIEDVKELVPSNEGNIIGEFFRQHKSIHDHTNDPVIDIKLLNALIIGLDEHMNINTGQYITRDIKNERVQLISLSEFMKWWLTYKSEVLILYDNNHRSNMQYNVSDSIYFTGLFSSHLLKQRTNIASLLKTRVPSLTGIVSDWELTHISADWNASYNDIMDKICKIEYAVINGHDIDLESVQAESQVEAYQEMRVTSAMAFYKFLGDFSTTAMKCCEVIVDEYCLPDELKSISKVTDGHQEEDEMYSYDNVIFRIAAVPGSDLDATVSSERHADVLTDDFHNRKCTGLAFHSSQYLQQVVLDLQEEDIVMKQGNGIEKQPEEQPKKTSTGEPLPKPHIDLMATVDYCGYRIEIHVPRRQDAGVLIHGTNEDTNTVVSESEIISELLTNIAMKMKMEMFNRDVTITSFARKPASFICPNLKIYKYRTSSDYYFTHTDVLLPQDLLQASATTDSVDAIELDTRKLRPELLKYLPSSSTVTSHICREDAKDQNEINQIAQSVESLHYLYAVHIPETASLLDNMSYMVLDSYGITKFLHDRGINCRMIGILYSLSKVQIVKNALLCEAIARTCKTLLFSALRQCSRRGKGEANIMALLKENLEERDFLDHQTTLLADKKRIVLDFFNLVLGSGNETKDFWYDILEDEILKKFNISLISLRRILTFDPKNTALHLPQLFIALQYHTGVVCTNYQKVALNLGESELPLTSDDFKNYFTVDAMLPMLCPGVCGKVASAGEALLGCELFDDAIYSFRLRLSSYKLAGGYINSPKFVSALGHSTYLLALSHYLNGQYSLAIDVLKSYTDIYENESPLFCRMLTLLMSIKFSDGKVDEAMVIFEKAINMYTFCLGPNHPIFSVHFCTLGDLYFKEKAYTHAKVMLLLAYESCSRILGDDHIATTAYRTKLASLYMKDEKCKKSEELLLTNYNISTGLLVKKVKFQDEAIEIYFGLATSLSRMGRQDEALKLLIKVKNMCKSRKLKVNYGIYLSTLLLLSDIYNVKIQSAESQNELEDAWSILQQNKDLKITSYALVKITCLMLSSYVSTLDLQVRLLLDTVEKEVDSEIMPRLNLRLWDESVDKVVDSLWTHKPNEFVETIIKKYCSFDVMNSTATLLYSTQLQKIETLPHDSGLSLALQLAVVSKLTKNSNVY